nr:hypothetical protein [Arthrobotrys musiformis]QBM31535.1 hypothetical protein [Arthrobotrys musiformis]QBM31686.1 hypothetical protein [Arthrobotrys musiformis]
MTISYGVTKDGIKSQLISDFFNLTDVVENKKRLFTLDKKYINPDIEYTVYFNIESIRELSGIIHSVLYEQHVNLEVFVKYLKNINKFLHKLKLDIGVVWKTPSGLIIEQKYIKTEPYTYKTMISHRTKSITLSKPTNLVDIKQQNQSIVPNIVHSMDASNISILINNLIKNNHNIDISTIHDSFSSQANNIELLSYEVKVAFLHIYKDQNFINEFHDFILEYISKLGYSIDENNVCIGLGKKISIPEKPYFKIDYDIKECVLNSKYLIG